MANKSAGESSLSRAVRILEAFDPGVRDLSANQIATKAGLPLTTAHRILTELSALGLLERTANRRYRIGLKLWEVAVRTPGALGIREIAMPALHAAHRAIGHHVQLGVLHEGRVLYLERLSAPDPVINFTIVGGTLPLSATSSGRVFAAFGDPAVKRAVLAEARAQVRNKPPMTESELAARLKLVRSRGYEVTEGFIHPDATSIAVPVFGTLGDIVAAVSAVVPSNSQREEFLISTLNSAASAIRTGLRRHYTGVNGLP